MTSLSKQIKFNEKANRSFVDNINLSGRGGAEKKLLSLFCDGTKQINAPLYDFIQLDGTKIECKKQENTQWFDIGKYHNLSEEDKNIMMLFILHNKGKINDKLYYIPLGEFLNLCCNDTELAEYGWTWKQIKRQYEAKQESPKIQSKACIRVKSFVKKYEKQLSYVEFVIDPESPLGLILQNC